MQYKMRDSKVNAISHLKPGAHPGFMSRLAGIRCPECATIQPFSRMERTNPGKGWNKFAAHECKQCSALLFFTGKGRYKRFFLLGAPVFFLSAFLGAYLVTRMDGLSYYSEARKGVEPNFLGAFFMITLLIIPGQLFLKRWEDVAVLAEKDAPV